MDLTEARDWAGQRHPWEQARATFFRTILSDAGLLNEPGSWLDVGSGDAWLARVLASDARDVAVTCWDPMYTDEQLADESVPSGVRLTRDEPAGVFDLVLALDVAEHVEDDKSWIQQIHRHLDHQGHLLFSVPAHQWLYSDHDAFLHHFRRYSRARAAALLEEGRFEILRQGGLFTSLLPLRLGELALSKVARSKTETNGVGAWTRGRTATRTVSGVLALDAKLSLRLSAAGIYLPGLSYWALCKGAPA